MLTKVVDIRGDEYAILPDNDLRRVHTVYGKSTDIKPTEGIFNADRFYEMDTGNVFMFDEETAAWILQ